MWSGGNPDGNEYPSFQVWRPSSVGLTVYNKVGQIQLSDGQVTRGSRNLEEANIVLTDNTIEFQSGDVVGYYQPPDSRYQVMYIQTNEYRLYQFNVSSVRSLLNLSNADGNASHQQPMIQFNIGEYIYNDTCLTLVSK